MVIDYSETKELGFIVNQVISYYLNALCDFDMIAEQIELLFSAVCSILQLKAPFIELLQACHVVDVTHIYKHTKLSNTCIVMPFWQVQVEVIDEAAKYGEVLLH